MHARQNQYLDTRLTSPSSSSYLVSHPSSSSLPQASLSAYKHGRDGYKAPHPSHFTTPAPTKSHAPQCPPAPAGPLRGSSSFFPQRPTSDDVPVLGVKGVRARRLDFSPPQSSSTTSSSSSLMDYSASKQAGTTLQPPISLGPPGTSWLAEEEYRPQPSQSSSRSSHATAKKT